MPDAIVRRAARPEDLPAILELTSRAFGEHVRPRMAAMLYGDATYRPEQSRLALVDGVPVSHVRVAPRPIRYGAATLLVGGVGAVATLPAYQGRGLASVVLADAASSMAEAGYPLGMLFTGIPAFYMRLGWVPFPEYQFLLRCVGAGTERSPNPSAYTVRPFDERKDLAAVARVYDAYDEHRTGTLIRDLQTWRDEHSRVLGMLPAFVAARDDQIVAYAAARDDGASILVNEAACLPGHEAAFRSLAHAIVARAHASAATVIEGQLPRGHGLLAALQEHDAASLEGRLVQRMLLLLNDLDGLLGAALPVLADRLRRWPSPAVRTRVLGLRVAGQEARLALAPGRVRLTTDPADRILDLPLALFFRLFFGETPLPLLAEELAVAGVALDDADRALLAALFPPQDPVYWRADHF